MRLAHSGPQSPSITCYCTSLLLARSTLYPKRVVLREYYSLDPKFDCNTSTNVFDTSIVLNYEYQEIIEKRPNSAVKC